MHRHICTQSHLHLHTSLLLSGFLSVCLSVYTVPVCLDACLCECTTLSAFMTLSKCTLSLCTLSVCPLSVYAPCLYAPCQYAPYPYVPCLNALCLNAPWLNAPCLYAPCLHAPCCMQPVCTHPVRMHPVSMLTCLPKYCPVCLHTCLLSLLFFLLERAHLCTPVCLPVSF